MKFKDLKFNKSMKLKTSSGDLVNLPSLNSIRYRHYDFLFLRN